MDSTRIDLRGLPDAALEPQMEAEMERLCDEGRMMILHLPPPDALAVVSALQLALAHPGIASGGGPMRAIITRVVDVLGTGLGLDAPALAEVIRRAARERPR